MPILCFPAPPRGGRVMVGNFGRPGVQTSRGAPEPRWKSPLTRSDTNFLGRLVALRFNQPVRLMCWQNLMEINEPTLVFLQRNCDFRLNFGYNDSRSVGKALCRCIDQSVMQDMLKSGLSTGCELWSQIFNWYALKAVSWDPDNFERCVTLLSTESNNPW